jgi:DNA modification methylase
MCGSGSTLVAGIKRGCNPIGFELQEVNYNISINNVSEVLKMKDAGRMDLLNR